MITFDVIIYVFFFRGGAMGLLESDPSLIPVYVRVADKFVNHFNYAAPMNVLWTYYFISGQHDKALPLWNSHVKDSPQIMFQKVCQTARSTGNADLASRLVDLLKDARVRGIIDFALDEMILILINFVIHDQLPFRYVLAKYCT